MFDSSHAVIEEIRVLIAEIPELNNENHQLDLEATFRRIETKYRLLLALTKTVDKTISGTLLRHSF